MQSSSARQPYEEGNPNPRRRDFSRNRARPGIRSLPENEHTPQKRSSQRKKKKDPKYDRVFKGSRNMPSIFRRGHIYFLVENEATQYRIPRAIVITVIIVFICAMASVLTHAQITGIERQISRATVTLRDLRYHNIALDSQAGTRYTLEQIEYLASTRLGMIHPDPSQIIEIYVPPQNHVRLNRAEHLLPRENYFWLDIRAFANGLFSRIFGG
jgi:cell division protein FtsL